MTIWQRPATELARQLRARELSAREVVAAFLSRIDEVNPKVNAIVTLVAEITPAALDALALHAGDRVWASVKATEITTYPG